MPPPPALTAFLSPRLRAALLLAGLLVAAPLVAALLVAALLLSPALAGAQARTLEAPAAASADPSAPPATATDAPVDVPPVDVPAVDVPPVDVPPPTVATPVICNGGRAASEATLGRCCWPAQSFSVERARCEGAPLCPAGTMAHGDDCVGTATAPVIESAAGHSLRVFEAVSPPQTTIETTSSIQHGVVGAGVTLLLAGYVASATYGPIMSSQSCGSGDASGLIWIVPLAGSLIGSAVQRCGTGYRSTGADATDWALAVGTAAFQVVGLVVLIVGASKRPITIERGPDGTRRVELDVSGSPTLRF